MHLNQGLTFLKNKQNEYRARHAQEKQARQKINNITTKYLIQKIMFINEVQLQTN